MDVTIPRPENFEHLKSQLKKEGLDKLHVLSDFDRTLTHGTVDGTKTPSIMSLLRDGNHLSKAYAQKAHALFDHYHPIEIDPHIPLAEKKKAMQEWWRIHNQLLIESGLSKSDLQSIVKKRQVKFRNGVEDFLDFLHEHNIPLVILSASGCGDAIELFFKNIGKDHPNIFYVTNQFNWDENGKATSAKEPIIHPMNKDETLLKDIPRVYEAIKDRKNVILLGDSLGDLGMIEGFDYDHLLKIGFLNSDYDPSSGHFEKSFDIVLEGDEDFNWVNQLIRSLI